MINTTDIIFLAMILICNIKLVIQLLTGMFFLTLLDRLEFPEHPAYQH